MSFWESFWPALGSFLVGSVIVGFLAWLWRRSRSPRVVIGLYPRNGASTHDPVKEPWLRWYHAQVRCETDVAALHPELLVWPHDSDEWEQWAWPGHKSWQGIHRTPILIPIVLGVVPAPNPDGSVSMNRIVGGDKWVSSVNVGEWCLTPDGLAGLGRRFVAKANTTYTFKVRVMWLRDGTHQAHQDAEFRLVFKQNVDDPLFEQVVHHSRSHPLVHRIRRRAP